MEGVLGQQQECRMSTKHRDMMYGLVLVYLGLMKGGLACELVTTEAQKYGRFSRLSGHSVH